MKKLLHIAAVAAVGLGLSVGTVAASTGTIDTTGPDSRNRIEFRNESSVETENNNDVRVRNNNPQHASSGDAKVRHNTTGGDAESGEAMNDSLLRASLMIDNSSSGSAALGCGCNGDDEASIEMTGPDSHNSVVFRNQHNVSVANNNSVQIENNNEQHAYSGDAKVYDNTTGGDATSGDATNISTTEVTLEIVN